MSLGDALSILQAAAIVVGAAVAVWKIASTTGALCREIAHLGITIGELKVVVERVSHEVGCLQTRVAVIEARNGFDER